MIFLRAQNMYNAYSASHGEHKTTKLKSFILSVDLFESRPRFQSSYTQCTVTKMIYIIHYLSHIRLCMFFFSKSMLTFNVTPSDPLSNKTGITLTSVQYHFIAFGPGTENSASTYTGCYGLNVNLFCVSLK